MCTIVKGYESFNFDFLFESDDNKRLTVRDAEKASIVFNRFGS